MVSGWQIYNNKGKVVEQYEPFFDKGFEYVLPQLSETSSIIPPQLGVKVKTYYDPLGRVIRTKNPDNSEQRVIYGIPSALNNLNTFSPTPWEQYTYDANDLAPLTNPTNSHVPETHFYTPKSALMDALGRTIESKEHKAHYNDDTEEYEDVIMKYHYDIRGNLLEVRDSYNRKVFEHIYDLRQPQEDSPTPPLWTKHIDSGISTIFFDVTGRVTEMNDAKGAFTLNSYDDGSRPIRLWGKDNTGENVTLRQVMEYGDDSGLTDPENENLKGRIYKHYDEAGLVEIPEYDFKGNVLTNFRQCISDTELMSVFNGPPVDWEINCYRVDWTGFPSILDSKVFETDSEFDALNRITKVTYPEDADSNRKIGIPVYNRAGALQKIEFDGTDYVSHIAYNSKGQRLLITFGNDVMTRYVYDSKTFRILRLKSEKYTQTDWEFTPDSGTTKQDYAYVNDLIGNIVTINDKSPDCGVGGTSSLEREFEYDPLYRLIEADGRENNPSTPFPWWDDSYRSTDNSLTTAYTQHYEYDKLGNILKLQHIGDTNFTRNFDYSSTNNKLNEISVGANTYTYLYDNVGNQIKENTNRFFEWDFANNVRCFYNQAGTAEPTIYAQYLYDSYGNRVKKIVRTQGGDYESISYINGMYEYRTDGTDEQTISHIMDDTSRISMVRTGDSFGDTTPAIKYSLEDHLGSSTILLETNASLINKEEYYPFGETSFGSYAKKAYRYSGKEKDAESGLYYYGARYYSPMNCRFTSCDPLMAKYPGLSAYVAFNNNPIYFIDPNGKEGTNPDGVANEGGGAGDKSAAKHIMADWNITPTTTKSFEGVGGMKLNIPSNIKPVPFIDYNKDGVIGFDNGTPYEGANTNRVRVFTGHDGSEYSARFNKDGSFKGYWTGKSGEYGHKEYENKKYTVNDVLTTKAEQGFEYLSKRSQYKRSNFEAPQFSSSELLQVINSFSFGGKTWNGSFFAYTKSFLNNDFNFDRYLDVLYIGEDGADRGYLGSEGYVVTFYSRYKESQLDPVLTFKFESRKTWVDFVGFLVDNYGIGNEDVFTNKSLKPYEVIGKR